MNVRKDKSCICPYCLEKFFLSDIQFRAPIAWSDSEVDQERKKNERKYQLPSPAKDGEEKFLNIYVKKEDSVYENFWGHFDLRKKTEHSCHVVIDRANAWKMNAVFLGKKGYKIPEGIKDSRGNIGRIRICPKCHNELPLEYGFCPIVFISVIGDDRQAVKIYFEQMKEVMSSLNKTFVLSMEMVENGQMDYGNNEEGKEAFFPPVIFKIEWDGKLCGMVVFRSLLPEGMTDDRYGNYFVKCIKCSDSVVIVQKADNSEEKTKNSVLQLVRYMGALYKTHNENVRNNLDFLVTIFVDEEWRNYNWISGLMESMKSGNKKKYWFKCDMDIYRNSQYGCGSLYMGYRSAFLNIIKKKMDYHVRMKWNLSVKMEKLFTKEEDYGQRFPQ